MVVQSGSGNSMTRGQSCVIGVIGLGEIVSFENSELELFGAALAMFAKVLHGERKQLSLPFAMEQFFGRIGGIAWLDFRALRIKRGDHHSAASLLSVRGGMLVGCKTVERHSQIGPERRLLRIEAPDEVALQGASKEALSQVLGFLVALTPLQPEVFVDRLPVERGHLLECVIR